MLSRSKINSNNYLKWLLLSAGFIALHAAAFSQAKPTDCSDCRLPDAHNTFEKTIIDEAYSLDSTYKKKVPIFISDQRTEATDNEEILISKSLIKEITQNDKKLERLLLRIVLSHERAHILQNKQFPYNNRKDNPELQLQLECHADIVAGVYVCQEFLKRNAYKFNNFTKYVDTNHISVELVKKTYKEETDYLSNAFNLFVKLGSTFEHSYHPLAQQRLLAAKTGYYMGTLIHAEELRKFTLLILQGQPGTDDQKMYAAKLFSAQVLDFRNDDNDWKWGLRQAARIIHPNPVPQRYLQIEEVQIHYDTSSTHNLVYFGFMIKNTAPFSIIVDYAVACNMVDRIDPGKLELSKPVTAKNSWIRLAPGRSYQVVDSLYWSASKEQMPSLNYFDDPTSFYVVDFANEDDRQKYAGGNIENANLQQNDVRARLTYLMERIAHDKESKFDHIRGGPAILNDNGSLTFPCFSPASGIKAVIPAVNKPYVGIELFSGTEKEALATFEQVADAIKTYFQEKLVRQSQVFKTDGRTSMILYIKNKDSGVTENWNLSANMDGRNSIVRLNYRP